MFILAMAEYYFRIENRYPFLESLCRDFIVSGEHECLMTVKVSDEEILEEGKNYTPPQSEGYCEAICAYRQICRELPKHDIFLFHSAVIVKDCRAYAFTAPSGTGKSTHLALWQKHIPGCFVLNGDKPLCRMEKDGTVTVFGTPWNGKEGWGTTGKATLTAVIFLDRGEKNAIRPVEKGEIARRLLRQTLVFGDADLVRAELDMMNRLSKIVPFFVMSANMTKEAPKVAYDYLKTI